MTSRRYVSPTRAAAAAETRTRIVEAARSFLRREDGLAGFSLDAIARAAGVTRLTVYHQFGSRRGLLEAVFDEIARRGGLARLAEIPASADTHAALAQVVEVFCQFWSSDAALGRLHDAMAFDHEFAEALGARNERRRKLFDGLVRRDAPAADEQAICECVDLLFGLTSNAMYRMLSRDRPVAQVCALLQAASADALDRLRG